LGVPHMCSAVTPNTLLWESQHMCIDTIKKSDSKEVRVP